MAAAGENENYRTLFMDNFPDTEFLEPSEICNYFKINHVWKLSEEKATDNVRVVASLQFHSLQILSPTLTSEGVYRAKLEYERVDNVTRITGADLVPQHAYYYLVMKIYELFLHPAASEIMFREDMEDIAQFITGQLNSGLADGRAFFEDKVGRFLRSHPSFLKSTDEQELQNNINAIWDLLRSDEYKNAGNTVQKGIVSTISRRDVEEYSLEGQGKVSPAGEEAFKKTVYGFHVLVYVGGHVISMSLNRDHLFHVHNHNKVFSFFNSDMIKYMASLDFVNQVYRIINQYNESEGNRPHELVQLKSDESDRCTLTFVECGCKSPGLLHDYSNGKRTLTTKTKLPGRREPIVGQVGDGRRYILVDNFPLPGSTIQLIVTSENPNLPNFCEYADVNAVHRVLGIEFGKDEVHSLETQMDSPPQLHLFPSDSPQPSDPQMLLRALVNPSRGAPVAVPDPAGGLFGRVRNGVGAACNFIRGIFFPHTPTCSAEDSSKDYANIGFRQHVVFCAPTNSEDSDIKKVLPESEEVGVGRGAAVSAERSRMAMTRLPWLKARELWLGVDDSHGGARRPVSRKYRNNKKNISRKKGKKRISLRHRRSRRRLRRRSHSLCLKN